MELKQNLTAAAIAIIVAMMISGAPWSWGQAARRTGFGAMAGGFAGPAGIIWGFNNGAMTEGALEGMVKQFR